MCLCILYVYVGCRVDIHGPNETVPGNVLISEVAYSARPTDDESDYGRRVHAVADQLATACAARDALCLRLARVEKQRRVLESFADAFLRKGPTWPVPDSFQPCPPAASDQVCPFMTLASV